MKSLHSNSRLAELLGDGDVPLFTKAHVEYLEKKFVQYLADDVDYDIKDIAKMQGSQIVVSHIRALVVRQTKERT